MIISATNVGGVMTPVAPLPKQSSKVVFDGSSYQVSSHDELFAVNPTTPGVTGIWNGTSILTPSWFGIHASGYPIGGRDHLPTCSAVRTHDWNAGNGITLWWLSIQPTATTWNWTYADSFVDKVYGQGKDILWMFGPQTPAWASARPTENNAYGRLGMAAEPADLNVWYNYCYAVANRYKGKIKYYEVWNEINLAGFWTGTTAKMAELVVLAAKAIRAADPEAKVVGPSIGSAEATNDGGPGVQMLVNLYAMSDGQGGTVADWIDIISFHSYPISGGRSNSWNLLPLQAQRLKTNLGNLYPSKPIWDTELGVSGLPVCEQAVYGRRLLMRRLVLHSVQGASRAFFYDSWNTRAAFMRDAERSVLVTWENMQQMLCSKPVTNLNWVNDEYLAATIGGVNYLI